MEVLKIQKQVPSKLDPYKELINENLDYVVQINVSLTKGTH